MLAPGCEATDRRMTLMDRLREDTRPQHTHAESRPLERALVGGEVSRTLYVDYLSQRLFIHANLETHLRRLAGVDARFGRLLAEDLFQEANLRHDLEALGVEQTPSPVRHATTRLIELLNRLNATAPVALLGAYYVFEGSKNGARYIARAIGNALGLKPGPGLLYLDPHGAAQRVRWQAFRAAVDAEDWSTPERNAIVTAARATFDAISALDDELWESRGD